ncbi:GNAT family N-acetyltransferase [Ekhidna sp.]|uniref:GNAT family N-acetyltransferase n=1 Tax=Ekhidna sp. TaxID=2608089 RepID=UPI003511E542
MDKNFSVEFIWQNASEELKKKVVAFWINEGAIKQEEDAISRSNELLAVCKDQDGNIIGVSTGVKSIYPALKNHFLVYRSYVTPDYRHQGIAGLIYQKVYDELNKVEVFKGHGIIGILSAFENAHLNKDKRAVWKEHCNLTFIGFDHRGVQLRVSYFDDAEINLPGLDNQ